MSDIKNVLCYGDSLTWGWVPVEDGAPSQRFDRNTRWTGVMAKALGEGYHVIEEGLSARTTSADDPNDPRLNGAAFLPTLLASHMPLDLVVVMLGTNDTKAYFRREPIEIANGMGKLVGQILTSAYGVGTSYPAPKVLVIAPPPLTEMPHPWFHAIFEGGHRKSAALAGLYEALAAFMKVNFLNAGDVITTDGCDGIHFTEQNNADLGAAVAAKVKEILE